jgi:prepilin-type N-terminal cleavage/methylation domain-containing protein
VKNERGFTLIEVMVACALISVALVGMAGAMTTAYGTIDKSGEQTTASTLAMQRMEWLRNQAFASSNLSAGSVTETLTGTYAGYTRITTIVDNTPRTGVKRLTVQASSPEGTSMTSVSYMTAP